MGEIEIGNFGPRCMHGAGRGGEKEEEEWGRVCVSPPRVFTPCSAANLSTSWTFECLSAGEQREILLAASDFTVHGQT